MKPLTSGIFYMMGALLAAGCASIPDTRFYTLTAPSRPSELKDVSEDSPAPIHIEVMPVNVPEGGAGPLIVCGGKIIAVMSIPAPAPRDEGVQARALGMDYLHYGVGAAPLTEPGVTAVCDFLDRHAQGENKVLLHCRRGGRAIALLLLHQARAQKWSADQVFAKGKAMGLEVDGGLRTLVETYLRDHPAS